MININVNLEKLIKELENAQNNLVPLTGNYVAKRITITSDCNQAVVALQRILKALSETKYFNLRISEFHSVSVNNCEVVLAYNSNYSSGARERIMSELLMFIREKKITFNSKYLNIENVMAVDFQKKILDFF